jgi:hypothetical protein
VISRIGRFLLALFLVSGISATPIALPPADTIAINSTICADKEVAAHSQNP